MEWANISSSSMRGRVFMWISALKAVDNPPKIVDKFG